MENDEDIADEVVDRIMDAFGGNMWLLNLPSGKMQSLKNCGRS
jgi:hypothetical protein